MFRHKKPAPVTVAVHQFARAFHQWMNDTSNGHAALTAAVTALLDATRDA